MSVKQILFVCTGNTCRSPMAEVILKRKLKLAGIKGVKVISAGLCAEEGEKMSENSRAALKKLGFKVTDSSANFLFVSHPLIGGKDYYLKLKERGILVRHFDKAGASEYVRITVGTAEQMQKLIKATEEILALNGGGKAENI